MNETRLTRRIVFAYAAAVLLGVVLYAWLAWAWFGWREQGPNAFPGSPDAGYLWGQAKDHYFWASGVLAGLALGSLGFLPMARAAARIETQSCLGIVAAFNAFLPIAALLVACFLFCVPGAAHAEDLSGHWLLEVQDSKHKTIAALTVRFTNQKAESCLRMEEDKHELQWRRLVVESHSERDAQFFPSTDPLAFALNGNKLWIGRLEVCDGYSMLNGPLGKGLAQGRYFVMGQLGDHELGFFKLTWRR